MSIFLLPGLQTLWKLTGRASHSNDLGWIWTALNSDGYVHCDMDAAPGTQIDADDARRRTGSSKGECSSTVFSWMLLNVIHSTS
mmetsp:Transcript_100159/g.172977  ORF Transcript_100159/g.172977 Transcript_100159/m.172977 type:complete len:84 (-) Transcript_100159:367-618(-)